MRVGLSSFSYTWAIAAKNENSHLLLSLDALLERALSLNVDVLQIADNLPLHEFATDYLIVFRERADQNGIRIEVGTRGISPRNLENYLEIASLLNSPIVRIVIDSLGHEPDFVEIIETLKPFEKTFKERGVKLAIENHDRLTCSEFIEIVKVLGTDWVGICLDTVNSLGCLESPNLVVPSLSPLAINVHMKDFEIVRSNENMGFDVRGTALGDGKLDVPWVIQSVGGPTRDITAVIELWTPRQPTYEQTTELEALWAMRSVNYLRAQIQSMSNS